MNFLSGNVNPFGSEVGQLIDAATDISSPEENVGLYFEICDMINLREDVAKDAMRAIRKKIVVYAGKKLARSHETPQLARNMLQQL